MVIPDVSAWVIGAIESRMRCRVLALELQCIMGRDRGRIAAWCCRFFALIPSNPGYEDLLRLVRALALAGRVM